jgi:DNA-binding IclR family transcriptional regulator
LSKKLIKSIEKAVEILDCFHEREELGITEIANTLGYSKSTVHDTIDTLTELGLVYKDEETKKYSLGIKLFEYGYLFSQRNTLRTNVKNLGRALSDKYEATCHLATYDKNEIVYLDKFEYQGSIVTSYSQIGKRVPMTVTGLGKAMLAYLPEDYRKEHIYTEPLPARTEHSITDVEELENELREINQNGYSIDNEESVLGLRCLACPIFDNKNQVVAAISVSLLAPYFPDELIPTLAQDIGQAARQLSSLSY